MKPFDTTDHAHQMQIDIFREMGAEKRLQAAIDLAQTSRKLLAEGVRMRHPEYNEEEVKIAVIRLMLGESLFLRVYPEGRGIQP